MENTIDDIQTASNNDGFGNHPHSLLEPLLTQNEVTSDEETTAQVANSWISIWYYWNQSIKRLHLFFLIFMVFVLWPAGYFSLHALLLKTDSTFKSPVKGYPSYDAQKVMEKNFPNASSGSDHPTLLVVLQSNSSLLSDPFAKQSSLELEGYLNHKVNTTYIQVSSYYGYQEKNLQLLSKPFLSHDEKTTFLQVTLPTASSKQNLDTTMYALDEFYAKAPWQVGFTGLKYFSRDLRASTRLDLHRMDAFVVPLALALVGWTLLRQMSPVSGNMTTLLKRLAILWMLPFCAMLSTISTWSLIMNYLVNYIQITQFTPSIMMSLTLGMGIDYTLFLVSRFISESTQTEQAMFWMLEQAGHVVVVSGTTLLCTFLGLVLLPLPMLQSIGIGATISIVSAIAMNLLIIPSLLYCSLVNTWLHRVASAVDEETLVSRDLVVDSKSIWIRLARLTTHPYKSIIVVLSICQLTLFPIAWNSLRVDASDLSFESLLPQNAPSLKVYHELVGKKFGPGKLGPFHMIIDGSRGDLKMNTAIAFDLQHDLLSQLLKAQNTTGTKAQYIGVSVAKETSIPYSIYTASKQCAVSNCSNDLLRCLHALDTQMVSDDHYSTYILAELSSVSPFSQQGIDWLDTSRRTIHEWTSRQNVTIDVHLDGSAAVAHDAVQAVYSWFPCVVAVSFITVLCLLSFVFRSVMPPLRSLVSIVFTLTISFGSAVLVYQDGIFASFRARPFMVVDPELSWIVPIMSFSIMVGLALDYDIFLTARILEFRLGGFEHKSSIAAGLYATGPIITSAGLIMALSFGSLLASHSQALEQWAFLVTVAVLVDTFLVRTILVPAMMTWIGPTKSWYPRTLPIGELHVNEIHDISLNE